MTARCAQMMEMKDSFAAAKVQANSTVLNTMRAINVMQTEIQYKFKKGTLLSAHRDVSVCLVLVNDHFIIIMNVIFHTQASRC
jgi:hypothetical protein